MTKKSKNNLQKKLAIFLAAAVVLFAIFGVLKNTARQSPQLETNYQLYQSPTYGFTIEYPKAWEIRKDTQVFENGDAVAFGISGLTQKENSELNDGAQVAISKPFSITNNLSTWIKEYFSSQAKFSKNSINERTFEKVIDCSGLGCMTYYYTLINDRVFGVGVFAEGADKMVYDNAVVYMLKSLQFNNATDPKMLKEDAIAKVKALPEVIDYLKRVPTGLVAVNGDEDNAYLVQVYEVTNGHTATFNWYKVDKKTGEIKKEF